MRRHIVAVIVLALCAVAGRSEELRPSMKCRAIGYRMFQCDSPNVGELAPHWAVYDAKRPYTMSGDPLIWKAPFAWTVVELRVAKPEGTYILRAWVRSRNGRAVFMSYDWSSQP